MRFALQLPTHRVDGDDFTSGGAVAEMARCAEASGFDSCFVTDHPFPGDRWLEGGGHHALDPFVALSFAAAATTRIRVQTHILVLPYRNPFLVAKSAATLDHMSGGRLVLGVAAGYLKSEFRALGADFEHRNEVTDESVAAIRRAWSERGVALQGRGFEARGNTMLPPPAQQPGPPIWIGGNSLLALRRAARLGDGWVPFPNSPQHAPNQRTAVIASHDDLRRRIARFRELCREAGRSDSPDVCFAPVGADMFAKDIDPPAIAAETAALGALGVTWTALSVPARTRAEWCDRAAALGEHLTRTLDRAG